jgi:predicted  nucleic acid-binding Zn-ribbon protein
MVDPSFVATQPPLPEEHIRKQTADIEMVGKIAKNVNSLAANLRILEERYSNLRNRLQASEQGIIVLDKDIRADIKLLNEDALELKKEIIDIRDKLRLISSEIKNLVNKNEFKVVERYLDIWQPMNFVTRNELRKMLEEKIKERMMADRKQ